MLDLNSIANHYYNTYNDVVAKLQSMHDAPHAGKKARTDSYNADQNLRLATSRVLCTVKKIVVEKCLIGDLVSLITKVQEFFNQAVEKLNALQKSLPENLSAIEIYQTGKLLHKFQVATEIELRKLIKKDWHEYIQNKLTHVVR